MAFVGLKYDRYSNITFLCFISDINGCELDHVISRNSLSGLDRYSLFQFAVIYNAGTFKAITTQHPIGQIPRFSDHSY